MSSDVCNFNICKLINIYNKHIFEDDIDLYLA